MMRKLKLGMLGLLAIAACVVLQGCASSSNKHFNKKSNANVYISPNKGAHIQKVAIMPFKAPTELVGSAISDLFVTEILRTGRYSLVERNQMASVLGEAELALAGLTVSQAAEVARMAGADGVLIGTVLEYQTQALRGHAYPVVGISARLIDTKTGEIVWSADMSERAKDKRTALSEQARRVVHSIASGVYYNLKNR